MNKSGLIKKMLPIYLASFVAWFHCIAVVPLGYIYNTYPNMESLVMTIAVLPSITATLGGLLSGRMVAIMGKKKLVIVSMILMLIGGLGILFFGDKGIWIAIVFSGISGFAGGTIPAANYETLIAIAPENLRDKVCGWSDALCSLGLAIAVFISGMLASGGVWTQAYAIYYIIIPVLLLTIILYPNDEAVVPDSIVKAGGKESNRGEKVKVVLPGCIIALLVIKIFTGMFYTSFSMFSSDYIINDLQLGSSTLVGTVQTVTQVVNIMASAVVFLWLKFFKGFSSVIAQIVIGVSMLGIVLVGPSIAGIILLSALLYAGLMSSHSSFSTIMAMAPEQNAVGKVAGLLMAMTFIGEALCGYVVPVVAKVILGTSSAVDCMKVSAVISIVVGVISLPFFMKAYKMAYKKQESRD